MGKENSGTPWPVWAAVMIFVALIGAYATISSRKTAPSSEALPLQSPIVPAPQKVIEDTPKVTSKTFERPSINGYRLDWCHTWAANCGEQAARAWCVSKGFNNAVDWRQDGVEGLVTMTIGDEKVCELPTKCYSFTQITCSK